MLILVDLDGTLTATEDPSYKLMKDGQAPVVLSEVHPKQGAQEFVQSMKDAGHTIVVVSDSHHRWVEPVVRHHFNELPSISLCDKPNIDKVKFGLERLGIAVNRDESFVLGDTWLDIHMGRGLGIPTILIEQHTPGSFDERDGTGQRQKNYKAGPTYTAKDFGEASTIIQDPLHNLLAVEAAFKGATSSVARRQEVDPFRKGTKDKWFVRVLARQVDGECDHFDTTVFYREFERPDRRAEVLDKFSVAVESYLSRVFEYSEIDWHILTCIPDKVTTMPPDKMSALLELVSNRVESRLAKHQLFTWNPEVEGSIRSVPNRAQRTDFLRKNLFLADAAAELVRGRNVVLLDDQYTTGATAEVARGLLQDAGAECVLFVALYQLIDGVDSDKPCPNCGKAMRLKVRRDGTGRFYSCVSPEYKGIGCGKIVNIEQ